jgi:threonine dehydratase
MVGLDSIGSMVVSPNDIRAAAGRIAGIAARTPALSSRALDALIGARVLLKPEVLQHTGSFKFRGALNRISTLTDEQRERGVIAFSSGNHGQAVALACALRGIAATVVLPADAPGTKVEATRDHGAEILTYDRLTEDREAIARRLATERGLTLVAPFDDPDVIAGQGTAAAAVDALDRRHVGVVAAVADLDVVLAGQAAVGGVGADPDRLAAVRGPPAAAPRARRACRPRPTPDVRPPCAAYR